MHNYTTCILRSYYIAVNKMYSTVKKQHLYMYVWGKTAGHNRIPSSERGIPIGDFSVVILYSVLSHSSALTSRAAVPRLYITSCLVSLAAMPGVECAQIELILHEQSIH